MKTRIAIGGLSVAFAAVLAAGCDVRAQSTAAAEGAFERTLQVSGRANVRVTSRSGSIHVSAGAPGAVRVSAKIRANGGDTLWFSGYAPDEQVAKLQAAPPIDQRGSMITIGEVDDWMVVQNVSISYELTVPADTRLSATSRSGEQRLVALRGPIDASSRSGTITLDDVTGPLRLDSRSGNVIVQGEPADGWNIETRSGDVDVRVPARTGYNVTLETRSGALRTGGATGAVDVSNRSHRKNFEAAVRGGGARIDVQTRSGSISIE